MEKNFPDNSLLKLHPQKPPLTKSKSVSFSLDNLKVPSTDDLHPNYLVTRLKHPKTLRKTTQQETIVFDDNQQKITESLYRNKKFRLQEQRTLNRTDVRSLSSF